MLPQNHRGKALGKFSMHDTISCSSWSPLNCCWRKDKVVDSCLVFGLETRVEQEQEHSSVFFWICQEGGAIRWNMWVIIHSFIIWVQVLSWIWKSCWMELWSSVESQCQILISAPNMAYPCLSKNIYCTILCCAHFHVSSYLALYFISWGDNAMGQYCPFPVAFLGNFIYLCQLNHVGKKVMLCLNPSSLYCRVCGKRKKI